MSLHELALFDSWFRKVMSILDDNRDLKLKCNAKHQTKQKHAQWNTNDMKIKKIIKIKFKTAK